MGDDTDDRGGGAPQLPPRSGRPPLVSVTGRVEQVTQPAPAALQQVLLEMAAALPGVRIGPSLVCVEGTRAFHVPAGTQLAKRQLLLADGEFGHLHPVYDGSLHLRLPDPVTARAVAAGWALAAEPEGSVLVFAPRDPEELETIWQLVLAAYRHAAPGGVAAQTTNDAQGDPHDADPDPAADR
ncbi:luciferase family protein [Streptacidiphilus jiangxiensis]|uniref:Luciferase domain-containing protein n=1 Tax=Streptacidiphilus jiangxiensis TaxID=235985 RepID=A0A1H7ICP3_STRJI|nr:luciferase family protein [Streptacidiphilus jiangxiensis]SEK59507.1 hypothetical protein SAMN05414137_102574 [Streptacidiphilus jiangxiensis]